MDMGDSPFKNKARMLKCFSRPDLLVRLSTAAAALVLASCASVSVKETHRMHPEGPTKRPLKVFVAPFTFTENRIRVDREGAELEAFKFDLRERMTRQLIQRLPKHVAPGEAVAATAPLPRGSYWLITGNFDRVYQGSRFLRSVVGFGAGGTKMDSTVTVWDLSGSKKKPFLRIQTTGGSNVSPGVGGVVTFFVSGPMALTSLFNVVDGVRSGVTFDTIRTSREVNAAMSEFLFQQGIISEQEAVGPKRLGRLPDRMAPPEPRRPLPEPVP